MCCSPWCSIDLHQYLLICLYPSPVERCPILRIALFYNHYPLICTGFPVSSSWFSNSLWCVMDVHQYSLVCWYTCTTAFHHEHCFLLIHFSLIRTDARWFLWCVFLTQSPSCSKELHQNSLIGWYHSSINRPSIMNTAVILINVQFICIGLHRCSSRFFFENPSYWMELRQYLLICWHPSTTKHRSIISIASICYAFSVVLYWFSLIFLIFLDARWICINIGWCW